MIQQDSRYQYLTKKQRFAFDKWQVDESDTEFFFVSAADGWQLGVTHYPANPSGNKRQHPVVMCHGLGSNHYAFDPGKDNSISRYLAYEGFDVFAIDLRGHGISEKPGKASGRSYGWGIYEYRHLDIPALLDAIVKHAQTEQVHFIGHSMGGILLYHLAAGQDQRIRSGMSIGGSIDYFNTNSMFRLVAPLSPLSHITPSVPVDWFMQTSGKASRHTSKAIDPILVNPANISQAQYERFTSLSTHPVSSQVLRDLALAINGKGMRDKNKSITEQLAKHYPFPLLAVSGAADKQCPPKAANRFGSEQKVFGLASGHKLDYGHHDLVIGTEAPNEVWPEVLTWLTRQD